MRRNVEKVGNEIEKAKREIERLKKEVQKREIQIEKGEADCAKAAKGVAEYADIFQKLDRDLDELNAKKASLEPRLESAKVQGNNTICIENVERARIDPDSISY